VARLTLSGFEMPSADLGQKNPHASLVQPLAPIATYRGEPLVVDHALPYRMIDGYDRELKPKTHRVAVLESDTLRATFLLDLGGRLWSLVHKPTGRELLYVNPVFQPANFAIRNAWISGGIEWNQGIFGHSVFTCEPVFAARTTSPDGSDGLRIWEYERTRGVVWQLDVWAPEGSDFLIWSPRIHNPNAGSVPMYWWTCIAVTEEPGGRVLAPADTALEPAHMPGDVEKRPTLAIEPDFTYPQRRQLARDTYFELDEGERPWVAHVSANGQGAVHASSHMLKGRKLWVWGMERGGRRWQEWLSPGGLPYIEIQGGLAPKQSDYVEMPGNADWSWVEAFGPVDGIETSAWEPGIDQVKKHLERHLPPDRFSQIETQMREASARPPEEILNVGSGWGALESKRRQSLGLASLSDSATPFPTETITDDQLPWMQLLAGKMPASLHQETAPGGYVGPEWRELLSRSAKSWSDWLHLGVIYYHEGDRAAARLAWEQSSTCEPNGWAHRNLALLDRLEGDLKGAQTNIIEAHRLLPTEPHLTDEVCRLLVEFGEYEGIEQFLNSLPPELRSRPRVRLAAAQVALASERNEEVATYFATPCDLVDIREAERTLTDMWRTLCQRDARFGDPAAPLEAWDFRMQH